jgi:hypothetical protein
LHYSLSGSEKARSWIQLALVAYEAQQLLAHNTASQLVSTRVIRLARALTPIDEWEDAGLIFA